MQFKEYTSMDFCIEQKVEFTAVNSVYELCWNNAQLQICSFREDAAWPPKQFLKEKNIYSD